MRIPVHVHGKVAPAARVESFSSVATYGPTISAARRGAATLNSTGDTCLCDHLRAGYRCRLALLHFRPAHPCLLRERNANPNPARSGCLPRATLSELAQRRRSLKDPGWQHLLKCSPCYRDFLALREERARLPLPLATWRGRQLAALALVLLSIAAAGSFWLYRHQAQMPVTTPSATSTPVQQAEIDLRKYVVMRSEQDTRNELPPVPIPIGVVELTLLLPVGSEPGQYDIQLLDANLASRAFARGVGERQNYVVTVKARGHLINP